MFEYDKFPLIPGSSAVVAIRKENPSPDRASRPSRSPRSFSRLIKFLYPVRFSLGCPLPHAQLQVFPELSPPKHKKETMPIQWCPIYNQKKKKDIIPTCC